jgi:hypothetical protein
MRRVMVSYKVKPERVEENEALARAVYEELHASGPDGLQYATFRLDDGVSFMHIASVENETNPLAELGAFKKFIGDIRDRCDEPPVTTVLEEVGSYRLFGT